MGDLKVVDVHIQLGGERGDGCDFAVAVGNGHPHLSQLRRPRCSGRQADSGGPGCLKACQQALTVRVGHLTTDDTQRCDQVIEHLGNGMAVLSTDVGPDTRMPRSHPRHVTEPPGSKAQHGVVLLGAGSRQAHEGGSRQVRHVRNQRNEGVVTVR